MGRYRKNYFCVCEGKQEEMYLNHLQRLLNIWPTRVIKFRSCIDTPNRLGRVYEEYDSAALFDYDFNESQFQNYIRICKRFNRRFRRKNIYHAYSNANFDLWLILHKEDYYRPVTHNRAYIDDVKRIYGLGREDNIKNQDILETILKQITLDDVKNAIGRANKIKSRKMPEDGRSIEGDLIYENPDFSIHQFIEMVLKDSRIVLALTLLIWRSPDENRYNKR